MYSLNYIAQSALQSVTDLQKVQNDITSTQLTGKNLLIASGVILASFIIAKVAAIITKRALNRIPNKNRVIPVSFIERGVRYLVVSAGTATGFSIIGIDIAWVTIVFTFVAILTFLVLRPLVINLGAGILLRSRGSIKKGSEVKIGEYKGEVMDIGARTASIKTRDWKVVHIPNKGILSREIITYNNTPHRRSQLLIELDQTTNLEKIYSRLPEELKKLTGVLDKPSPSIRAYAFGDGTVKLKIRWWHESSLSAESKTKDLVANQILKTLNSLKLEISYTSE